MQALVNISSSAWIAYEMDYCWFLFVFVFNTKMILLLWKSGLALVKLFEQNGRWTARRAPRQSSWPKASVQNRANVDLY